MSSRSPRKRALDAVSSAAAPYPCEEKPPESPEVTDAETARWLKKVRGEADEGVRHETTIYRWWNFHEGSSTSLDHTFATRRQALLYIAKRNSEEFAAYIERAADGRPWSGHFDDEGSYKLTPNAAFDLTTFSEMDDDAIQAYAETVCNAFSVYKVDGGQSYRYAPRETHLMGIDALVGILTRDKPTKEERDHHARQALLLSDIAGFD